MDMRHDNHRMSTCLKHKVLPENGNFLGECFLQGIKATSEENEVIVRWKCYCTAHLSKGPSDLIQNGQHNFQTQFFILFLVVWFIVFRLLAL